MTSWDERFRTGEYPANPDPSPVLREYVDETADGRALDVACGTGRNALFLAEQGYEVDALDRSIEGLRLTEANAVEQGVDDRINPIQADATEFEYPEGRYDVVTISFFRVVDRLTDIKGALRPDGLFFYQHHLRSEPPATVGPSTDRHRFGANELLRACLDLTVLYYEESSENRDGELSATVEVVARNSHGDAQSYPETR
ncbi:MULTISPECIES: class I SAM-dependent methyltransferase [Halolamina]|uniref:Methyltransferase domain-containing protein n=1 Tax=Halolamina pelagica TaxID=699431 RepID=A0A1I5TNS1_9EURY|nr:MULTISPECIES: class I SAM-dependent methyltransferase [Halolamina]NHX37747.1 class I SAM-dependent methyltransferase [Halolamina sp. R1-12]SFP84628.1 Methyltransferase domain-containing protein [Halolamina pelagica]